MLFVIVGVLLLVVKLAEFGPFATWSWWIILAPFAAAAIWWQVSDSLGLTQRRAMDKMEQRKVNRRERQLEALGIDRKPQGQLRGAPPRPRRRQARRSRRPDAGERARFAIGDPVPAQRVPLPRSGMV